MAEEQNQDNRNQQELQESTEFTEETDGNGQARDEASPEECIDQLVQKEQEIKSLQDRVLRIAAEMDNTRKRLERERSEGICFANESLIRILLPVLDNLERAIQHAEQDADPQALLDGVKMTVKGFQDALGKFGCVPFESVGKPFDPNYHEAMMQQESSEQPENIVLQEFQKGYTLHDRLIRPAMVVVSKEPKN